MAPIVKVKMAAIPSITSVFFFIWENEIAAINSRLALIIDATDRLLPRSIGFCYLYFSL